MNYVFSTLASDQQYTTWTSISESNHNEAEKKILIRGGAGISNKHFITPRGMSNEVSDEDIAILETIPEFQKHKKNGFIQVLKRKAEVDKIANDMSDKDGSRQKTEKDFPNLKAASNRTE